MMKKQLITQNDIRRDLLAKINKAKKLSIFLTIIIAVAIPAYILFIQAAGLVYHHDAVVDIIKGGKPPLYLITHQRVSSCGLDKQKQNICRQTNVLFLLAERERFELSERYQRSHDFQSCALDQLSHLSVRPAYYITKKNKNQELFKNILLFFPFLQMQTVAKISLT